MEKNLIVSRVPTYPEIAKASRVQGFVVVQALITKTGVVSRVHVVQGDTRLRTAAIDAIYRQRYRPYVVNGVAVDVVTTISMNFTPPGQ
jgi:TonB family protein